MQIARQDSETDTGFTPYFLERISELPAENAGSNIHGFGLEDIQAVENKQSKDFHLNFESPASFPSKLYKCLIDAEKNGFTDVVSWQADGASFKVHNQERFVKDVLPLYFGAIKFKSWQRQLNLYGFTRVHKGLTRGSYTHDHFVRGRKSVSLEISRQKWTGNSNNSSVVMPVDAKTGSESNTDFTLDNFPHFKQSGMPRWQPDSTLKKNDFEVNYTGSIKGPSWQNDILVDKGSLMSVPASNMFEAGVNFGDQDGLPSLDMDSMSLDSSISAVMPSAEELSFLLDFDDRQLFKNGPQDAQSRNQGEASKGLPQMNFFGRGNYEVSPSSLQVIANTLPAACDLMDDLSAGESPTLPTSAAFAEAKAAPAESAAAASEPRSFPWKLHEMLDEVEINGFQDIISWEPDGLAFKVHDCRLFVEKVMPLYFDQSRYESFRRQLRKYGFSRLHKDRYRGAYHHDNFQRENKHLCKYITRGNKNSKSDKSKSKEAKQAESSKSKSAQKAAV